MRTYRSFGHWTGVLLAAGAPAVFAQNTLNRAAERTVGPVPEAVREEFDLHPTFYKQYTDMGGIPIVSSEKCSPYALLEVTWIMDHMLDGRPDLVEVFQDQGYYIVVMAHNEYTSDVPGQEGDPESRIFRDRRSRGLGGIPVSCAEENMLGYPNDPYWLENIFIHEFAHGIHGALRQAGGNFNSRLRKAYEQAMEEGLWKNAYAANNHAEYWAEAVQCWFDDNRENDALHNHVDTRAELKEYDPRVAALCEEIFGEGPWRYTKPAERSAIGRLHLTGFDFDNMPTFHYRDEPLGEAPLVEIQTELGDFLVEVNVKAAPKAAERFVWYAHDRHYDDGHLYAREFEGKVDGETITLNAVRGEIDPLKVDKLKAPIELESTKKTGLSHTDGTVSLVPTFPGSGMVNSEFVIMIGDHPEFDAGGSGTPDGRGYAAFGKVVEGPRSGGMDVVRALAERAGDGALFPEPIGIRRALRRR